MFQQQNQCQHRLNCVLPRADNCQAIAEITNACNFTASNNTRKQFDGSKQLPFENISGKSWMIFFFAWRVCVGGQNPVLRDTRASDPRSFCHSPNQRAAGRANEALVAICRDAMPSIAPALGPAGGLHERVPKAKTAAAPSTVRSLQLWLTVRARTSGWGSQSSSLLREKSRSVQAKWDIASVLSEVFETAVVSLRGGVAFFQPFPFKGCLDNPALSWCFQTGRQDHDAAILGLLYLTWWKHFCNYSKNIYFWYSVLSLNSKENISKYFSSYFHRNPIKKIK